MAKKTRAKTTRASRKSTAERHRRDALAIGRRMAAEVIEFRNARLRKRAAAVRRAAGERTLVPQMASAVHVQAAGGAESSGVLVAEGDSWFDYPWHDVLRDLEDRHGYEVESVAHRGDSVELMAYGGGQLEEFTRRIEKVLRQSIVPSAILLSGGGNDVAGPEFGMLLDHVRSATAGLNDQVLSGVIDQRIHYAYITILSAVTEVCRQRTGRALPIIIHGYDHPVPDGRGFMGGWGPLPGPWLEPGFREKGFDELDTRIRLAAVLIDRFNVMLQGIAAMPEFGHVRYLDLRGTLSNGQSYKTWWTNELHPTERGFAAIADLFASAI
jgi:hypothetical protein